MLDGEEMRREDAALYGVWSMDWCEGIEVFMCAHCVYAH